MEAEPSPRIRDITPGGTVRTVLLVASAASKQARNGPFWQLELKDATGSLEGRIWSPLSQTFSEIPAGALAEVEGRAEQYREQTQLSITGLRLLSGEEAAAVDTSLFLAASKVPPAALLAELERLCRAELHHRPWREFALAVLADAEVRPRLLRAPAARGIHHAWVGGLLEHTLGVARLCLGFAEQYPELDRQTLLAAAVFHDIGKLWELSGGLSPDYTDEGRLLGHISIGVEKLAPFLATSGLESPLVTHFRHLILSHHGLREYGSPALPQTAEAFALHYADNLDSKLAQCRGLFEEVEPGVWSPYQRTLDRSLFLPQRTPNGTNVPASAGAEGKPRRRPRKPAQEEDETLPEVQQCSLL